MLPGIWTGDVDLARELIQNFFMTIAVSLAINSSMEVIEAQSKLVLRRVRQNKSSFVRFVSGGASHGGASSADAPSDPQSRGPGFPADGESDGELSESSDEVNEESVDL